MRKRKLILSVLKKNGSKKQRQQQVDSEIRGASWKEGENAAVHITKLANDLLATVFQFLPIYEVFELRSVCKKFQNVLWNVAGTWKFAELDLEVVSMDVGELMLSRSGKYVRQLCSLYDHCDPNATPSNVRRAMLDNCTKIEKLTFCVNEDLLSLIRNCSKSLVSLELQGIVLRSLAAVKQQWKDSALNFNKLEKLVIGHRVPSKVVHALFNATPMLRELYLKQVHFQTQLLTHVAFKHPMLTRLYLSLAHCADETNYDDDLGEVLKTCPLKNLVLKNYTCTKKTYDNLCTLGTQLEILRLIVCIEVLDQATEETIVTVNRMSHLKHLSLDVGHEHGSFCSSHVLHLISSSVTELTLQCSIHNNQMDSLSQKLQPVKKLKLGSLVFGNEEPDFQTLFRYASNMEQLDVSVEIRFSYLRALATCNQLETLIIRKGSSYYTVGSLLTQLESLSTPLLPHLKSLILKDNLSDTLTRMFELFPNITTLRITSIGMTIEVLNVLTQHLKQLTDLMVRITRKSDNPKLLMNHTVQRARIIISYLSIFEVMAISLAFPTSGPYDFKTMIHDQVLRSDSLEDSVIALEKHFKILVIENIIQCSDEERDNLLALEKQGYNERVANRALNTALFRLVPNSTSYKDTQQSSDDESDDDSAVTEDLDSQSDSSAISFESIDSVDRHLNRPPVNQAQLAFNFFFPVNDGDDFLGGGEDDGVGNDYNAPDNDDWIPFT